MRLALALIFFLTSLHLFAAQPADTRHLSDFLHQLRALHELDITDTEFQTLQDLYSAWVDRRIATGVTLKSMAQELHTGKLVSYGGNSVDSFDETLAGFITPPKQVPIHGTTGVEGIAIGLWTGSYCALDETVLLYNAQTHERLTRLNAETPRKSHYYLSSVDVGPTDQSGTRLIASGWTASNCTSDWNGTWYRIDSLQSHALKKIASSQPEARNSLGIKARIHGSLVQFRYDKWYDGEVLFEGPVIARFNISDGNHLERRPPLAPTRGGFISEWFNLSNQDRPTFSSPAAMHEFNTILAFHDEPRINWLSVARCGPARWKLRLEDAKSKIERTLIISGSNPSNWRVVALEKEIDTTGCRVIPEKGMTNFLMQMLPE